MMRLIFALMLTLSAGMAQAQNCAGTVDELKNLIGDQATPMRWHEKSESNPSRVLTLALSNAGTKGLLLRLTLPNGTLWANFYGQVCRTSTTDLFQANVNKAPSSFGPGAPALVKFFGKPSRISLDLRTPNKLKVSVSKYKGTYEP